MAVGHSTDPGELLTPQELESLSLAQDIYGARAKQSTEEFGRAIELDSEMRALLVGQVGLKLAGLEFEERRTVAIRMAEVALILASVSTGEAAGIAEVVPLKSAERKINDSRIIPLTRDQRRWLTKVYPEEVLDELDIMPNGQRLDAVQLLLDTYLELAPDNGKSHEKLMRTEEVMALMHGKDLRRIAGHSKTSRNNLHQRMHSLAARIVDTVDEPTRLAILRGEEISLSEPAEATGQDDQAAVPSKQDPELDESEKTKPLMKGWGLKWFSEVYDVDTAKKIALMEPEAIWATLDSIADRYRGLSIARVGADLKEIRLTQIKLVLEGNAIKDISAEYGVGPDAITQGLLNMAIGIKKRVSRAELIEMIQSDKSQTDFTENFEEPQGPSPLNVDQQRWLESLLDDIELANSINGLTKNQQSFLAQRFSELLYPAIVGRFGPEVSRSRVTTMFEFMGPKTIEEIAQERRVTDIAIKSILEHAKNRIKAVTPKEKLSAIVTELLNTVPQAEI